MSRASKILSKSPQDVPRRSKIVPGCFKTAPGRPKTPPGRLQGRPGARKITPGRPKTPLRASGEPQKRPRTPPRRLQGRPGPQKITPGRPQDASTGVRGAPKSPQDAPKTPPRASRKPKIAPKSFQDVSRRPKNRPSPCRKGRFGVDVGPMLCRCWLRLDAFSACFFCLYSFLLECFKSNAFEQIPQTSLAIGGSYLSCRELPLFSRIFPRRQPTCLDLPRLA